MPSVLSQQVGSEVSCPLGPDAFRTHVALGPADFLVDAAASLPLAPGGQGSHSADLGLR
jgi:hypothetical protein